MSDRRKNGDYFHITYKNNKWHVKEVKNNKIKIFSNKEEAIIEAKKNVKKSVIGHVVIHNEKGKFETINKFT